MTAANTETLMYFYVFDVLKKLSLYIITKMCLCMACLCKSLNCFQSFRLSHFPAFSGTLVLGFRTMSLILWKSFQFFFLWKELLLFNKIFQEMFLIKKFFLFKLWSRKKKHIPSGELKMKNKPDNSSRPKKDEIFSKTNNISFVETHSHNASNMKSHYTYYILYYIS